jgi:hypothetical protein
MIELEGVVEHLEVRPDLLSAGKDLGKHGVQAVGLEEGMVAHLELKPSRRRSIV